MGQTREDLLGQLLDTARVLPDNRLQEVLDFAGYLQQKLEPPSVERGSAEALLRHAGTFQFEPGELDGLLADIDNMRRLDAETDE